MKVKTHLSVKQREAIAKEVESKFLDCEQKCREHITEQYAFLYLLATAMVLTDDYDFPPELRAEVLKNIKNEVLELANFLCSNKCYAGKRKQEVFDSEANLSYLERFSKEYGLSFNEKIFEEVNYE